jgi:hypothetical protein
MGIRRIRNEQGQPIEDVKAGDDPVQAIKKLYEYGRKHPSPSGRPHDYPAAKGIPFPQPSSKRRDVRDESEMRGIADIG